MSIKRQRGLTLIELVLFMVIVGAAAAGIIGVLNIGGSHSADPVRRKQALMIAEAFMEEVLMARFTFCDPNYANAATAQSQQDCGAPAGTNQPLVIGTPINTPRPYGNVANYGSAEGAATRSFRANGGNGVDVDINGRPMGQNGAGATVGNVPLAGITTTVTLRYLSADPNPNLDGRLGGTIASGVNNINALRITVRTTYGTGANDFVELDAYRTRYAPRQLP